MRLTEFAPAHAVSPTASSEPAIPSEPAASVIYGPPQWAKRSFTGGFPGSAFTLQPDGTLRCPAERPLYPQERQPEHDGSLRVLYAGCIGFCRSCSLREQCQEHPSTKKPRRVSAVFWPLPPDPLSPAPVPSFPCAPALPASAPLLWCDWPRRALRRHWTQLLHCETASFCWKPSSALEPPVEQGEIVFTREQRARYRLFWSQRLARNARPADAPSEGMDRAELDYHKETNKGHGRLEVREIWTSTQMNAWFEQEWAGIAQVFQIRRTVKRKGEERVEVVYGITNLPRKKADAKRILGLNREHWSIENRLHYRRDVTLGKMLLRSALRVLQKSWQPSMEGCSHFWIF